MSDALALLRTFVKGKREFHEEDDKIIFGDVFYYKNIKTTYLIYGTGKDDRPKDYYTLECLAFLIKNRDLQHSMYVKNAGTRNISVVLRPDRRELLSFLDGEVETTASIDKYAPIEIAMQRPQAYTKPSASSGGQKRAAQAASGEEIDSDALSTSLSKQAKLDYSGMDQAMDTSGGAGQATGGSQSTKESFIGRLAKKFDDQLSSRPITDNIMPLSDQLSIEKIVSIKLKKKAQQRTKVSAGVEIDDDLLGSSGTASGQAPSGGHKSLDEGKSKYNYDYSASGSGFVSGIGSVGTDDSDTIMREIVQRERTCRTRFTVLQSTGKQFDKDISAFLQSIKAKEEGGEANGSGMNTLNSSGLNTSASSVQKQRVLGYNRFDQERYQTKDDTGGFVIDTKLTYQPNGGSMSLSSNSPGPNNIAKSPQLKSFQSSQLIATQQKSNPVTVLGSTNSVNKPKPASESGAQLQKRSHQNPIIIIPAARTSLIQMANVLDILEELKFITTDEKKKKMNNQNLFKESELVMHRREDGKTVQFKVIDNVNKMQPHDWDRVVAVFAHGAQWQFKDWQLGEGNPCHIFTKVKGFHLKMSGSNLDPNIAKWPVSVIELDTHKRHLDRARLLTIWDEIDRYVTKMKPHFYM